MKHWLVDAYKHNRIVAVVCNREAGPGWRNAPVWVFLRMDDGSIRQECIQPDEQSPELVTLYEVGHAAHVSLRSALFLMAARIQDVERKRAAEAK